MQYGRYLTLLPWLIQSFLSFDSMCDHSNWNAVEQYFTVVSFTFNFVICHELKGLT